MFPGLHHKAICKQKCVTHPQGVKQDGVCVVVLCSLGREEKVPLFCVDVTVVVGEPHSDKSVMNFDKMHYIECQIHCRRKGGNIFIFPTFHCSSIFYFPFEEMHLSVRIQVRKDCPLMSLIHVQSDNHQHSSVSGILKLGKPLVYL